MHAAVTGQSGPIHYATLFDRHFLTRGLALYRSLRRHSPPFVLWILCLDDETLRTLDRLALDHVVPIPLADLERHDPALLEAKAGRRPLEFYWTCTAPLLAYLVETHPEIDPITYLDADLYFFGDPTPIYEELGSRSILLIPARRPKRREGGLGRGLYMVSMQVFRRTAEGLACLGRWREQSLEWCFDRIEDGRFGDQAYLMEWPERYEGVAIVQHKGAGLGLWNVVNFRVTRRGGRVFVDEQPLIFYHFHRFRVVSRWFYDTGLGRYGDAVDPALKPLVYAPYARELRRSRELIRAVGADVPALDNVHFGPQSPAELLRAVWRRRCLVVTDAFTLYG